MTDQPKPPFSDYEMWAQEKLKCEFGSKIKNQFESNTASILAQVEASPFCQELPAFLLECEKEYEHTHSVKLLMTPEAPKFLKKSYESSVDKSYRSNILENPNWPDEPDWKWTTTSNWYSQINDIVRTTIVCKYLDGPAFLANKLESLGKKYVLKPKIKSQGRDSGYYAQHFYAKQKIVLLDDKWQQTEALVKFEIQITTQMQELLRALSHTFYQEQRLAQDQNDDWKWDHKSPRFRSSFMGHTLHLLEGTMLELREQKNKASKEEK